MKLHRTSMLVAIASLAIAPLTLSGQGAAAQKPASPAATKPTSTAAQTPAQAPVKAPAAQAPAATQKPAAASNATEQAKCKDGTMYSGTSRQGACSSHGGVAQWLTASKSSVPKGATAKCNDGTYYTKAERQGACSGHKGVAEWLKKG
jgi:hypothetical protein